MGTPTEEARTMTTISLAANGNNLGDVLSKPHLYFGFPAKRQGCRWTINLSEIEEGSTVVIGGGGLLSKKRRKLFGNLTNMRKSGHIKRLIAWGIGLLFEDNLYREHTKFFGACDALGLRDMLKSVHLPANGLGYTPRWVPCASCMSPQFDDHRESTRKFVLYTNAKDLGVPDIGDSDIPHMHNRQHGSIEPVLDFLGSAETVLTNSYHGMYWSTLMGKKVVLLTHGKVTWNGKYSSFPYPPAVCQPIEYRAAAGRCSSYPQALQECRSANEMFYRSVEQFLV